MVTGTLGYSTATSSEPSQVVSTGQNLRGSKFSFQPGQVGVLKKLYAFISVVNNGVRLQGLIYDAAGALLAKSNVSVLYPGAATYIGLDFDGSEEITVGHADSGGVTDYYFVLWCRNRQSIFDLNITSLFYKSSGGESVSWTKDWAHELDPGSPSNPIPSNALYQSYKQAVYIEYDVVTLPAADVYFPTILTTTTATLEGGITDDGGAENTERGFVYDTVSRSKPGSGMAPESSSYAYYTKETGSFTEGAFDKQVTGLTPDTEYFVRAYTKNVLGYAYSDIQDDFDTDALTDPQATSVKSTNIGGDRVKLHGLVDDDGGEICDEVGFVIGTTTQADPGNVSPSSSGYDKSDVLSGAYEEDDAFSSTVTGLDPVTTYYWRAYVHNSAGYNYGLEINFDTITMLPTPDTETADNITTEGGRIKGEVGNDGGLNCGYGFVWDYSSKTKPGNVSPGSSGYGSDWTGAGTVNDGDPFNHTITGELLGGIVIYYRTWLENTHGYAYGEQKDFLLLLEEPSVSVVDDVVAADRVTIRAQLEETGGADITRRGMAWGETAVGSPSQSPPFGYETYYEEDGDWDVNDMPDLFSKTLQFVDNPGPDDLAKFTKYYWRGYGFNSEGYGFSSQDDFTSDVLVCAVRIDSPSNIAKTSATLNGTLEDTNGENADVVGFIYNTSFMGFSPSGDPALLGFPYVKITGSFAVDHQFASGITGQPDGAQIYQMAFAHNSAGWVYSEYQTSFYLGIESPTVISAAATGIGGNSATLNGEITGVGGQNCSSRGFVWGRTSKGSETFDSDTKPSSSGYDASFSESAGGPYGLGAFTHIPALQIETTYYFRAFSYNTTGYGWGEEFSFKTLVLSPAPPFPDSDNMEEDAWGGIILIDPDNIYSTNNYAFLVDAMTIRPGITDESGVFMISINDNERRDETGEVINKAFNLFTFIKDRDPVQLAVQRGTSSGAWDPLGGTDGEGAGREILLGGYVMQRFWTVEGDGRITAHIIGVDFMHAWKKIFFGTPAIPRDYELPEFEGTGGAPIWGSMPDPSSVGVFDDLLTDVNAQISNTDAYRFTFISATGVSYFVAPSGIANNNLVSKTYKFASAFDTAQELCEQLKLINSPQLTWEWAIDPFRVVMWWPRKAWSIDDVPQVDAPINYATNIREVTNIQISDTTDAITHVIVTDAENDRTLPTDIDALCYAYRMWDERGGSFQKYKSQRYDSNSVPAPGLGFVTLHADRRKAVDRSLVVDDEGHPAVCFMKDDWEDPFNAKYRLFTIESNLYRSGEDWFHQDLKMDLQKYRRIRYKFRVPNLNGYGSNGPDYYRIRLHWNEKLDEYYYYDFGKGSDGLQQNPDSVSYDINSEDNIPDDDWIWIDLALPQLNRDGTGIEKTNGWITPLKGLPGKTIKWAAIEVKLQQSWSTPIGPHTTLDVAAVNNTQFLTLASPGLFIGNKDSEEFDTFNAPGPKPVILSNTPAYSPIPDIKNNGAFLAYLSAVNIESSSGNTSVYPLSKSASKDTWVFERAGWAVCFSQFHFVKTLTVEQEDTSLFRPPFSYAQIYSKESDTLGDVGDISHAIMNEHAKTKSYAEILCDGNPLHKIGFGVQVDLKATGFNNVKLPIDDIEYVVDKVDFYTRIRVGNQVNKTERTESAIINAHSRNIKDISVKNTKLYLPEDPPSE